MATEQDGHAQPSKGLVTPRLANLYCVVVLGLMLYLVRRAKDPFHEVASPPMQASALPLQPVVQQRSEPVMQHGVGDDHSQLPFPARAFWHIGNAGHPRWRVIAGEQLSLMHYSRLLESMNVTAVYVGDEQDKPDYPESGIAVGYGGAKEAGEWPTLMELAAYCRGEPNARVIYFHTKAARYSEDTPPSQTTARWRRLMQHFTIWLHRPLLLEELGDGSPYEVAGVLKRRGWYPHFSGNFWAAKCRWINELAPISEQERKDRYLAEFWIGRHPSNNFTRLARECASPELRACLELYECAPQEQDFLKMESCDKGPNFAGP